MALSGLHVVCGLAGGRGPGGLQVIAILGDALWSETLASPGTTTNVAPGVGHARGSLTFSVRSSADAWISIGPTPNASTGIRRYLAAGTDLDLKVDAGDKLAWVAA